MRIRDGVPEGARFELYWFSGTGNTLIAASELRDRLRASGREVAMRPMERSDPGRVDLGAVLGFVVSVAGQGTHPLVWEFLESLPEAAGTACFLVDTLGIYSGGILGPVRKILRRKGYRTLAAREILMPNNFMRKKSDPDKDVALVERGRASARDFGDRLLSGSGRWRDIPLYSELLAAAFRSRKAVARWKRMLPLAVDPERCTACGTCVRICPERALSLEPGAAVPVRGERCSLCHRCVAFCPAGAIGIAGGRYLAYRALGLGQLLRCLSEGAEVETLAAVETTAGPAAPDDAMRGR
ncbi:MAG TPA: EFR1 family ferrodoxin [Rectinemataceae bacterium]|nr:EFR1 family ferrodoxin [Rectinemataceae bacterium]